MAKLYRLVKRILVCAFILTLIGPFLSTLAFNLVGSMEEWKWSLDFSLGIATCCLFASCYLLPVFPCALANACGWVVLENIWLGGLAFADGQKNALIMLVVSFIALLLPLVGICLVKKAPILYRLFVYLPIIISIVMKTIGLDPITCISDIDYIILAIILDISAKHA